LTHCNVVTVGRVLYDAPPERWSANAVGVRAASATATKQHSVNALDIGTLFVVPTG
jgi:hypothetical protein